MNQIRSSRNVLGETIELIQAGAFDEAAQLLKIKFAVNPYDKESLFAAGLLYQALGNYEQSIETIKLSEYKKVNPAAYWNEIGINYQKMNNHKLAIQSFEKGIKNHPKYLNIYLNLAHSYMNERLFNQAARILEIAHRFDGEHPKLNLALASAICYGEQDMEKLRPLIKAALKVGGEDYFHALYLAFCLAEHDKDFTHCFYYIDQMIYHFPNKYETWVTASHFKFVCGEPEKALEYSKKAIEINPKAFSAYDNFLLSAQYCFNINSADVYGVALKYSENIIQSYPRKYNFSSVKYPTDKLKIGFVSGDIKDHPIFYWISSLFKYLQNEACEIYLYVNNPINQYSESLSSLTKRITYVGQLTNEQIAQNIFEDEIQILVDLSGHTGYNRLAVFALRPAPVQVSWLGQASPLGIKEIDYAITDKYLVKDGYEKYHTEKIYRMPHCFAPYPANDYVNLNINNQLAKQDGSIVLGSFNAPAKVNDTVIKTWAEIMKQTPKSQLILKNRATLNERYCDRVMQIFNENGITEERIQLDLPSPKGEYLHCFNKIDIALDPFPFAGGTTSFETLMMSVPFVTLTGERPAENTGESILRNAGFEELITYDVDDYIRTIVNLINDPERIVNYKRSIRNKYLNSKASDIKGFTKDFYNALKDMWEEYNSKIHSISS
jgi:protein O-GlcNAc transferase